MLRNEEHVYCKRFANFGPHAAERRQDIEFNYNCSNGTEFQQL
jgi:hypothetical protein